MQFVDRAFYHNKNFDLDCKLYLENMNVLNRKPDSALNNAWLNPTWPKN